MNKNTDVETFVYYLLEKIRKDITGQQESVHSGNVSSMEDYRFRIGVLKGLNMSIDSIKSLVKVNEEDE
jgi:hypothetical protein